MEAQIAHKIHPQEGPLPFARQRLVNFEHHRGRHREILPSKWHFFGCFEELKEAAFKVLHKNSLRDHAPHSGGKHNFIIITKNIKNLLKLMCCTMHAQKEQHVTHEIHTQEGLQCRSFGKSGCGSSAG